MPPARISVIIPTYQRCASVQRVLKALAHQSIAKDFYEVIVSIDGSKDDTFKTISRTPTPYRLQVSCQDHRGRAAACNAGIKLANGELLVFLDDDMEPTPDFLAAHWEAHTDRGLLGVIGAVPIPLSFSSPPVVEFISEKFHGHLEKLARPGYNIHYRDFYSGNFSIRRQVLNDVGGFNETFKIYGNEDGELAFRLLRAGVTIVYNPKALAYQHYTKDFAALAQDNFAKGETSILLANLHPATFADLKLSTYRKGPLAWRLLRTGLLHISRLWTGTPDWVIRYVKWLERRRPNRLPSYYRASLDYFYWLGAKTAMQKYQQPTFRSIPSSKVS